MHGRRLALAGFLPLAMIGFAEGAARLFHEPAPMRRVWDPFSYRIPHPNLQDSFVNADGRTVTVRLNELGMRGPRLDEPVQEGALTVVFLGGSTTENYAYELERTFPELIGSRLARALDRPIRVFNAGMSAASTSTSLARLQHQILDLEPDLVVVMHAINDLVGGFHPAFRADGRHLTRPPGTDWKPRSFLIDWVRARPSPGRPPQRRRDKYVTLEDYSEFEALQVFRRNLRSMAAVASAHSIPILFLTQAHLYREDSTPEEERRFFMVESIINVGGLPPDTATLARGMGEFNRTILSLAASEDLNVFDLASHLDLDWSLFVDECHLSEEGNRRVAEELTPVIRDLLREGAPPLSP